MKVAVTYDDSDIAIALQKIIKDSNSAEFVKLLTPMLCQSSNASTWFFKLMLGNKLPDIIPIGTLCKINVNSLGYGANKAALLSIYADEQDRIVATVKEFKGFHDYSEYSISYINIDQNDKDIQDWTVVRGSDLEVIEEI
jgi:hypothetical protein